MYKSRTVARSLAVVATAMVAPLVVAAPGNASTTDSGCTVSPKRPVFSGLNNGSNIPLIDYKAEVTCEAGLSIELWMQRWEQDLVTREGEAPDDLTGVTIKTLDFTDADTVTVRVRKPLPNTGPANEGAVEEVYSAVGFYVTSGPVTSDFTGYELTQVREIHR